MITNELDKLTQGIKHSN